MSERVFTEEQEQLLDEMYRMKRKLLTKLNPDEIHKIAEMEMCLRTVESIENTMMKKIKMEQGKKEDKSNMAAFAAEVLRAVRTNTQPLVAQERPIPKLGNDIPEPDVVPGELAIGNNVLDHTEVLGEEQDDEE